MSKLRSRSPRWLVSVSLLLCPLTLWARQAPQTVKIHAGLLRYP